MSERHASQASHSGLLLPVAYLDDVDGRKIVVQILNTREFALLTPPDYSLKGALRGEFVRDASLAKYGFSEFEEPQKSIPYSEDVLEIPS